MSKHVRVVFDRRKRVEATGKGNVEIIIQLSRLAVKKIIVDSMTPEECARMVEKYFLNFGMQGGGGGGGGNDRSTVVYCYEVTEYTKET